MPTLFPSPPEKGSSLADESGQRVFVFDAVVSRKTRDRSKLTEHTIGEGRPVADHVIDRPFEVTVNGLLVASPLRDTDASTFRAETLIDELRRLKDDRRRLSLVEVGRTYLGLMIVEISRNARNNPPEPHKIDVTVQFKSADTVAPERAVLPGEVGTPSGPDKSQATQDAGRSSETEPDKKQKKAAGRNTILKSVQEFGSETEVNMSDLNPF